MEINNVGGMNRINNNNNDNFRSLLSSFSTNMILKKYNLDYNYFPILFSLLLVIFNNVSSFNYDFDFLGLKDYLKEINYYYCGIIFIIIYSSYAIYKKAPKLNKQKYICIKVYDNGKISQVVKYLKQYECLINNAVDLDVGNPEFIAMDFLNTTSYVNDYYTEKHKVTNSIDTEIQFEDKHLNMKGYIVWRKYNYHLEEKEKKIEINFKYLELNVEKNNIKNTDEYLESIFETLKHQENKISLHFIKIMKNYSKTHYHKVLIYDGENKPFDVKEKLYIDTFFNKEKDRLWSFVKKMHFDEEEFDKFGQISRLSILLHGPPGTGKSSFAYRIAMCLNRNIVSLDLRDQDKKMDMYSILNNPDRLLGGKFKDYLFIFEEFDIGIKYLHEKENSKNKIIQDWVNNNYDINSYKNTDNIDDQKKAHPQPKSYYDICEEFCLKDLLEIFQGTVPAKGMIVIATTNNYEEIGSICPALFRPGRMTPIYFGYIEKDTLQDISKFYFEKKLDIFIPDKINIPTSQVIEIALEAKMNAKELNPFNYFRNKLQSLLK